MRKITIRAIDIAVILLCWEAGQAVYRYFN